MRWSARFALRSVTLVALLSGVLLSGCVWKGVERDIIPISGGRQKKPDETIQATASRSLSWKLNESLQPTETVKHAEQKLMQTLADKRATVTSFDLTDATVDVNGVATLNLSQAIPVGTTTLILDISSSVRNFVILNAFACNGGNTGAFVYRNTLHPDIERIELVPGKTSIAGGLEVAVDTQKNKITVTCDTVSPPSLRAVMEFLNTYFGLAYMFANPDGKEALTAWNDNVAGFSPDGSGGGWVNDNPAAGVYARTSIVTAANQHPLGGSNPGARRGRCRVYVNDVATGGDEEIMSEVFYAQPETETDTWAEMTHGRAIYIVHGTSDILSGISVSWRGLIRSDGSVLLVDSTQSGREFIHKVGGSAKTELVLDPGHFGDWNVISAMDNKSFFQFSASQRLEIDHLSVIVVAK